MYLPHEYVHLEVVTDKGPQHEFVLQAIPKPDVLARNHKCSSKLPLNIAIFLMDSTSSANFFRKMPKTAELLKKDENTLIFNGQTIVGDGTTFQLSAIMTGVSQRDNPEARRGASWLFMH